MATKTKPKPKGRSTGAHAQTLVADEPPRGPAGGGMAPVFLGSAQMEGINRIHDAINPPGPKGGRKRAEWSPNQLVALAIERTAAEYEENPPTEALKRPAGT